MVDELREKVALWLDAHENCSGAGFKLRENAFAENTHLTGSVEAKWDQYLNGVRKRAWGDSTFFFLKKKK